MKKTSTFLIFLSLLLIIPATISSVEEQRAKTMVANYLNNGGEMIMHSEDGSKELNLLKHFQGLSKLYQGEINEQDIKKFSNVSTWQWLTMLPSDYINLVLDFFTYQYNFDEAIEMIGDNTFEVSQEFLSKLREHLAWDDIRELYQLQADKKLQSNYSLGYSLIFLLKGFALFNFYQQDLSEFNIIQHWILIVMATGEVIYIGLIPAFSFPYFFDIDPSRIFLNIVSLIFMYYNAVHHMKFFAFLQNMISTINLAMISYQSKRCYDACEQKINCITIKHNEIIDDLQGTIQLLHNHEDTVLACYQGKLFNEISGVDNAKTTLKDVGSIIAQHIDPSIKPDHIAPNLLTDENESSDNDYEYDRANCFDNCCGRAMNIILPSCFLTACLGVFIQRYFSS